MTEQPVFTGVGVAIVTLFKDNGDLDAPATAQLAVRLVEEGVRAVVVAGSTGEAAALDPQERIALLEAVRGAVPGAVPVLAGTGAASARQAAALTAAARDHGADAVLALSPPGCAHPRPYYAAVARAAGDLPVLAYHFPKASAPGIPVELLGDLPVRGLKDSSGDPDRLLAELDAYDGDLYTGSSALLALAGPLGCTGAILALANVAAAGCASAFAGDAKAQRELAAVHRTAHERFPAGLKQLVAQRYGTSPVTRLG
ncbi:MAG: dihydrodipicolinate synthase family protein [Egibacteraceae bacterium]